MELNRVSRIDNQVKIRTVIMSVADRTGLGDFANGLADINPDIRILSTGGTFRFLSEALGDRAGKILESVPDYTGQPEMQGGLVKTLDYRIYLGLLSETYNQAHQQDIARFAVSEIDMVVGNLYPFAETVAGKGVTVEDGRTNIDIGGPCMLRASAKNFLRVASVCSPDDYSHILGVLAKNGGYLGIGERFELAKKSFAHTAAYDSHIRDYLSALDADALSVYVTSNPS